MDERAESKRRGLRMALRVAALAVGAGAGVMALAAEAEEPAESNDAAERVSGEVPEVRSTGYSCGVPTSRGPAAPPVESADFADLLTAVPV